MEQHLVDKEKPVIAITMGDASGIGPEVIVKALLSREIYEICRPIVVGDGSIMVKAIKLLQKPVELRTVKAAGGAQGHPGVIDLLDLHNIEPNQVIPGQVCRTCGKASVEYIVAATRLLQDGKAKALVTAPISKEATKLAGYGEMGHLEILASFTGARDYATMLVSGQLRVVHL
ncbi:MAG: 4-hydroxythreonine-4-phosphate dehydrogenase PdxA, partial [Dehalococcoidia bacterium]|nr:4-hydroxythreonine-4-phosphate dehydrogenase PdxA [Dehalococcoidia bacterium]